MPDLPSQLRHHLRALHAAGIEFVPILPPISVAEPQADTASGGTSSSTADPFADRRQALALLAEEVARCDRCPELFSTRTQTVFGVGPLPAEVCFLGEAPGADEDRQGEPFVGAAGQLFNKILVKMGLNRDDVYIANTLKCRPPRNATPTPKQCENCRPFLDRQLDLIQPKIICCLGGVAAKSLLNTSTGITRLRGRMHEYRGVPVICTYHPSYLLRLTGPQELRAKLECWDDMKMLLREMGRTIPGTG